MKTESKDLTVLERISTIFLVLIIMISFSACSGGSSSGSGKEKAAIVETTPETTAAAADTTTPETTTPETTSPTTTTPTTQETTRATNPTTSETTGAVSTTGLDPNLYNPDGTVIGITQTISVKRGKVTYTADATPYVVKGNKKTKVYHVTGQNDYNKISVNNVVHFATIEEAIAAGFRPASR